MLTVIRSLPIIKYVKRRVECKCDCGAVFIALRNDVISGNTRSCGCLRRAIDRDKKIYGLSNHKLHGAWRGMMSRCYSKVNNDYNHYGGRGITVWPQWHDVTLFIPVIEALLGPRPYKYSLDRIDNDGNYEPANVKWSSNIEQQRNRRNNHLLTFNGITKCVVEWAEECKLKEGVIHSRIRRGWTGVDLLKPVK